MFSIWAKVLVSNEAYRNLSSVYNLQIVQLVYI